MTQLSLYPAGLSNAERFRAFHEENPQVYELLVRLARAKKREGYDRYGMKALWETARWELKPPTTGEAGFTLNNIFTSYYARLIMDQEPDLDGFFELRGGR